MKFDKFVNNIMTSLVEEGRMPKSSKFSNINVDTKKLSEKLSSGDFDVLLKGWSDNSRYGNISETELTDTLSKVSSKIETYQPSSLSDLNGAISSVADELYATKGPRRKTFTERLTKAISNLILHKEYGLVTVGSGIASSQDEDDEEISTMKKNTSEYDVEGMSERESAIYEFIKQSDNPTTKQEIESQFPQSLDVVNGLIRKGFITKENDTYSAKTETDYTPVLDINDEEEIEEDPFEVDPDARSTFKQTFGDTRSDEGEWDEWDRDQVPSWLR